MWGWMFFWKSVGIHSVPSFRVTSGRVCVAVPSDYKLQDLVMNLARARVYQEPTGWHQQVVVITASLSVCLHLSLGDGTARLAEEVETLEGGVERFQDVLVGLDDGLTTALLAVSVEERRLAGLALHGRGLLRNTNTYSRLDSYRFRSLSPEYT